MRNVICALNISIDGCYDHEKLSGYPEVHEYFTELLKGVDLDITGRKMYELMKPYWDEVAKKRSGGKTDTDFADTFTAIESIVVSRTMGQVEGGPRILRDNIEAEILKLKAMPGKKISIGGMTLRSQLMAAGLIDEFYVVIQPVIIGTGPRLFNDIDLSDPIKWELSETKVMQCGCVGLHYLRR
ncbi:dihydrofolate reductase family protein [Mucilaginibacter litoreus]|uniref:Dihydrofolate reductase family protein n=1 Tax=Mucilaginibacter litoreus TaxID=1048221 RepID=A0ABW3AUM7_9SPHI